MTMISPHLTFTICVFSVKVNSFVLAMNILADVFFILKKRNANLTFAVCLKRES